MGTVPYGWDAIDSSRTSKTGRTTADLVPNWIEQRILARLLTGDLAAISCNEAARRLNAERVPAKRGGSWFGATIANLRRHTRLADEQKGSANAMPKDREKRTSEDIPRPRACHALWKRLWSISPAKASQ
jgi:hypothetical protein